MNQRPQIVLGVTGGIAAYKAAEIVRLLVKEENRIYLRDLYRAECRVAQKLKQLLETPRLFQPIDAAKAIAWAETKMKLQ